MTQGNRATQVASIANAASLSGAVQLEGRTLLGIQMPSAWTAAVLTFQVSHDGVTYTNLYKADGNEYSVTVAADRHVILEAADFAGVRYVKVRSGTAGAAVNQGAARDLVLVSRAVG